MSPVMRDRAAEYLQTYLKEETTRTHHALRRRSLEVDDERDDDLAAVKVHQVYQQ
jgi:hypothetical protein